MPDRNMRIAVFGLWHLGCVTAACLAEAGYRVVGLDYDAHVIADLQKGKPPINEPGLPELIQAAQKAGTLSFTSDASAALADAEVLWVAFDTPVNDNDEADLGWLRRQLDKALAQTRPGTLVLISSQVPVGFTKALEREWQERCLRFAAAPENLRLGKALDCFRRPDRIVIGCRDEDTKVVCRHLLRPFSENLVFMSVESAEMTKHAVNAFLAASVTFINELSRICEAVGADAKEVERGLKSEARIGPQAYLSPGAAFAGGTLARDVRFLIDLGAKESVATPMLEGTWASNDLHKQWIRGKLQPLLFEGKQPVVAILGLTYKPGTNTLRRSASIELCRWLTAQNVLVQGHDPAIAALPPDLDNLLQICDSPAAALAGADVAVIATPWPLYRELAAESFLQQMRRPRVIDQNRFLGETIGADPRVEYLTTGMPARQVAA